MLGALGVFEGDLGRGERGQVARLLRGDERPFDQFPQLFANHLLLSLSRTASRARGRGVWGYTRCMGTNEKLLQPLGFLASLRKLVARAPASVAEPVAEPELPAAELSGPSGLPAGPLRVRGPGARFRPIPDPDGARPPGPSGIPAGPLRVEKRGL